MGIIKNILLKDSYRNELLEELGFEYDTEPMSRGEGYVKVFNRDDGYTCLWVTISIIDKKVYLYDEYEYGGYLWDKEYDLNVSALEDKMTFINWLDELVGE